MSTVTCTNCDERIPVQDRSVGDRLPCPSCGQPVVVPSPVTAARPGPNAADADLDGWEPPRRRPLDMVSAKERVMAPAAALLATGIIGAALTAITLLGTSVISLVTLVDQRWDVEDWLEDGGFMYLFHVIASCSSLAGAVVVILGARKMSALTGYGFVIVACFVAMTPLLSPCWLIGIPVSIWALVVLNRDDVKAAFR